LLLLILDPTIYDLPPIKVVKKPDQVLYENELQLYNATRFVISSDDDFSMAKSISDQDESVRKRQERVILREIVSRGRSIIQLSFSLNSICYISCQLIDQGIVFSLYHYANQRSQSFVLLTLTFS
jgi:hypothetical protein